MIFTLTGSENAKRVAAKMRKAAKNAKTPGRAFRKVDKAIDKMIRTNFANNSGGGVPWQNLSDWTEEDRFKERNWYRQVPLADGIGRWTDSMFQGVMGRGRLGQKQFGETVYRRTYIGLAGGIGPREKRVEWFHEGHGGEHPQPERPFWAEGERSLIAKRVMTAHFKLLFES